MNSTDAVISTEWDFKENDKNNIKPEDFTKNSFKIVRWKSSDENKNYNMSIWHKFHGGYNPHDITFKDRFFCCLAYLLTIVFPLGLIALYILDDNRFVRFHVCRNISLCNLVVFQFIAPHIKFFSSIDMTPVWIFIFIACIVGLIQVCFNDMNCITIFDDLPFVSLYGNQLFYFFTYIGTTIILAFVILAKFLI